MGIFLFFVEHVVIYDKIHYNHLQLIKSLWLKKVGHRKNSCFFLRRAGISRWFSRCWRAFKYHKHSSIKCNELSESFLFILVHSLGKNVTLFFAIVGVKGDEEESLNLSTSLINMLIDDTSDFLVCEWKILWKTSQVCKEIKGCQRCFETELAKNSRDFVAPRIFIVKKQFLLILILRKSLISLKFFFAN